MRRHLGDVGHGGLLIADLAKQTLRHHENPFAGVGSICSETSVMAVLNSAYQFLV